jgi:hypothetical protein
MSPRSSVTSTGSQGKLQARGSTSTGRSGVSPNFSTGQGLNGPSERAIRLPASARGSVSTRSLDEVLAHVRPGCVVRLDLSRIDEAQARTIDFRSAVHLLRHLLGARHAADGVYPVDWLPVTAPALQKTSMKLGLKVARDTCRHYWRLLISSGVLVRSGQYSQRLNVYSPDAPHVVKLYRVKIRGAVRPAKLNFPPAVLDPSNRNRAVRKPCWWEHKLFGNPYGLPPPGISKRERNSRKRLDGISEEAWLRAVASDR